MRNVLFTTLFFFSYLMANAQIEISNTQIEKPIKKGNYTFGGTIGYYSTSETNMGLSYHLTEYNMNPSIGYFFINHLMLGGVLSVDNQNKNATGYSISSTYILSNNTQTTVSSLGIGAFVKYYFQSGWFLNLQLSRSQFTEIVDLFQQGTINTNTNPTPAVAQTKTTDSFSMMTTQVGGGYALFVNNKVSIEASLQYQRYSHNETATSQFTVSTTGGPSQGGSSIPVELVHTVIFFSIGCHLFL